MSAIVELRKVWPPASAECPATTSGKHFALPTATGAACWVCEQIIPVALLTPAKSDDVAQESL